jgi:streptomycin 6-kinase
MQLEPEFVRRMSDVFGANGRAWIDRLPSILDDYARRWQLTIADPFLLSYNYVAPAVRADGTSAVFKTGVPRADLAHEVEALQHWNGDGAVRVLESDVAAGVFLLERLTPGTQLIELRDDAEETRIAARLMCKLQRPAPQYHGFPTLVDWGDAFALLRARHEGTSGALDQKLFDQGEELYAHLVATQAEPIVLHGDLHHWNILRAKREPWLAIDPHGVVGEPAFEVAAYMHNPAGDPGDPRDDYLLHARGDARRVIARRLDIFAEELRLDRQRLRDWSLGFAVLSASWSDESHHAEAARNAMTIAAHLATM